MLQRREFLQVTNWWALADTLLHQRSVSVKVPLVESSASVWLATVDSTRKVIECPSIIRHLKS